MYLVLPDGTLKVDSPYVSDTNIFSGPQGQDSFSGTSVLAVNREPY